MTPFIQFFIAPFAKLSGMYTYLSPMLLAFGASDKKYDLHAGTSFDYLLLMRNTPAGPKARRRILGYFMEGLLKIIEKIERGELPESVVISGSSYFFSDQSASRLGFAVKQPSVAERLNVYINIIDLFWMYSYAQGKLTFPKLNEIKKAETDGSTLLLKKSYIEQMHTLLGKNTLT